MCFRSNWLIINSHHLLLWGFGWTDRSLAEAKTSMRVRTKERQATRANAPHSTPYFE